MLNRQLVLQTVLLGFSLISMQGVIHLLQILSAQNLSTSDFNFVRISESASAILSILISFGLPSVALVWGVRAGSLSGRKRLLKLSGGFMLSIVILVYFAGASGLTDVVVPPEVIGVSQWVPSHFVVIASFMSLRLMLAAMLQSRQLYLPLVYGTAVAGLTAIAAGGMAFIVAQDGVLAWLIARYTLEGVACAVFLAIELNSHRGQLDDSYVRFSARQLFGASTPVGGGLALRALIEHGPLLILAMAGVSAVVLSEVGTAVTVITVSLVPVGIVQGVLVPMLARSISEASLRASAILAAGAIVGSLAITAGLCTLLEKTSPHAPFGSMAVALAVAGIVVTKSMASLSGGLLLVTGRMRQILLLNVAAFVVLAGLFAFSNPDTTTTQGLAFILLAEAFGAAIYMLAICAVYLKRPASPAQFF